MTQYSFQYRKARTNAIARVVQILFNDEQVAETPAFGSNQGIEETVYTFNVPTEVFSAYEGQVIIVKFRTNTSNNANVIIDNINWALGTLSSKVNEIEGLSIFPNPVTSIVNITSNSASDKQVRVCDMTGRTLIDTEVSSTLDISSLNVTVSKSNKMEK
ncbi:T9SS type A sorting domain-containing protein [Capnocytophaga sp. ARDL2]|uniref:T9SS type A sorting domain-containing protein n=1 Tax=Capnocytophaga sp. ARDL2 TaxID=3238809 RepID=UPI003559330B